MILHLYWRFDRPAQLKDTTRGFALCGESLAAKHLTCDKARVTCAVCREKQKKDSEG